MLISGSDDTTIRFWDLEQTHPPGDLRRGLDGGRIRRADRGGGVATLDWVLYTPDGHFDASEAGRELVRFRQGDHGHALEQFDGTEALRLRADRPSPLRTAARAGPRSTTPPPVAIDPPLRDDPAAARDPV